ncbi:MAG: heparan-alpha-glucosaminide N-acetyltransferase domain-containing protein [Promethearchaeota archaeon]
MIRFKSIDIFRGVCMGWMFLGHLLEWWIRPEYASINNFTHVILDSVGASGFLFISGVSIAISYRNRIYKVEVLKELTMTRVRNSYIIRALFLLIIAIFYNLSIALAINDLTYIWAWFVLLTASISLLVAWSLLKLSKYIRVGISLSVWILNQFLFEFLVTYNGQVNAFGFIFHLLYNKPHLDPILAFFPFFLFGTVIGDLISDLNIDNSESSRMESIKTIKKYVIIGPILIIIGILLWFPDFLARSSLSWLIYSLGIQLTLLMTLFYFEMFLGNSIKKNYKFLFYFSYYSFTVYLTHSLLHFLFLRQLDYISIWFAILITFLMFGMFLKIIYYYWKEKFSLKIQLGRLSSFFADKLEIRKNNI